MQLVRKAMETSRTDETLSQEITSDDSDTEEEDKENEMQVDNHHTVGK